MLNACIPVALHHILIADADQLLDAEDLEPVAAGDEFLPADFDAATSIPAGAIPLYGSNLVVTATDAAGTNLSVTVTIYGEDQFGKKISEEFTSTGAPLVATGSKVFRFVDKVVVDAISNNAASDLLDIGTGNIRGIPFKLNNIAQVLSLHIDGAPIAVNTNTVDVTYSALKGDTANGCGSNSGVFAADDNVDAVIRFKPTLGNDGDDRVW
jgi:hypothetical protein